MAAFAGIVARKANPDDAALKSLPANYLREKKWQRKIQQPRDQPPKPPASEPNYYEPDWMPDELRIHTRKRKGA
jgi:hypothetical protein